MGGGQPLVLPIQGHSANTRHPILAKIALQPERFRGVATGAFGSIQWVILPARENSDQADGL